MAETADHSGVAIHPPLFFACALLLGVVINDRLVSLPVFQDNHYRWFGMLGLLFGVALVASGRNAMARHGTNVNPTQPTTTIVESGPFRFTRNPLYLGLTVIYVGLSLLFNTWWTLFLLVPLWLIMHFLVVLREEAYLTSKFGPTYLAYCERVRRYF